jgi:hypothetical protein
MTATQAPTRATATSRPPTKRRYRLLHSSGDRLITDRKTALHRLATLPGAKLFILPTTPT